MVNDADPFQCLMTKNIIIPTTFSQSLIHCRGLTKTRTSSGIAHPSYRHLNGSSRLGTSAVCNTEARITPASTHMFPTAQKDFIMPPNHPPYPVMAPLAHANNKCHR
jgi:hypothetical protein